MSPGPPVTVDIQDALRRASENKTGIPRALRLTEKGEAAVEGRDERMEPDRAYLCAMPVRHVFAARNLETGETGIILTGPS